MGTLVGFLRLALCNLKCAWCDTKYTWNFGDGVEEKNGAKTVRIADEIHETDVDKVVDAVLTLGITRLVVSGGEPLLQRKELADMVQRAKSRGLTWCEIETNGTLKPEELAGVIDQFNVSPKLATSGNPMGRYNPDALRALNDTDKAIFKFVYTGPEDLPEIRKVIDECSIPNYRVWLMAEGKTKPEQEAHEQGAADAAISNKFNFSPRLHVKLWGSKRGV